MSLFLLGSIFEYLSLFAADKYTETLHRKLLKDADEDTSLEIGLPEDVLIGKDFTIKASLKKKAPKAELRSVTLVVTCNSMYYTGVKAQSVLESHDSIDIKDAAEAGRSSYLFKT